MQGRKARTNLWDCVKVRNLNVNLGLASHRYRSNYIFVCIHGLGHTCISWICSLKELRSNNTPVAKSIPRSWFLNSIL
uniref:Macaca fascicularis brain cDNA clone: QflA-19769, similar to human basic leucine zipper nuclear factor 1 (JEM-1) (BLZF1), mRNA, RefSeq: NM_003666.2 n=1 Tax=Macaca fascicularis TaxID=9541 RepID=I7GN76_MACFA|nr:unnamed protein product [Macaca fascicularis]